MVPETILSPCRAKKVEALQCICQAFELLSKDVFQCAGVLLASEDLFRHMCMYTHISYIYIYILYLYVCIHSYLYHHRTLDMYYIVYNDVGGKTNWTGLSAPFRRLQLLRLAGWRTQAAPLVSIIQKSWSLRGWHNQGLWNIYIYIYGCESKRFGIEQARADIPFNTPFNTLLNRRVPIVQYPPFNTPVQYPRSIPPFNTLVQYPCSIPLFNIPVQ